VLGVVHDDLETGPCREGHFAEVFAILRDSAGEAEPYPGDANLMRRTAQGCVDAFPAYTGTTVSRSELQVITLRPLAEGWEQGDRTTICLLAAIEGDLVGSRRGTSPDEALPSERSLVTLTVGDCFSSERLAAGGVTAAVELVDCAAPHAFEVIATSDAPDDVPFTEVEEFAERSCVDQFEDYVGVPIDASARQLFWMVPIASNWDLGDRRSVCLVADPRANLVGSVRDTNR
jgi:hypothetical protein